MTDDVIDVDETLAHFGVKGMHWGVRHAIGPSGRVNSKRVISPSDDAKQVQALRGKHVSELSNSELRQLTTRVDLEQKFSKINPSTVKKGKLALAGIIAAGTTVTTVYNLVNSNAFKAIYKGIGKHVLKKAAGGNPNPMLF